jgi:AraC family transcriptional regulator, regulatory protein of adaptative response / methylated-DNA-[protein]-cysteine methyltransferase
VRGTDFQLRVWSALIHVPPGACVSYAMLAAAAGNPRACRATGSAVAANPVAFLIPCHRVIHNDGTPGQYRWGSVRKQAMLARENMRQGAS